jgi:hypothetical protein
MEENGMGRIIVKDNIKMIIKEQCVRVLTEYIWLKISTSNEI